MYNVKELVAEVHLEFLGRFWQSDINCRGLSDPIVYGRRLQNLAGLSACLLDDVSMEAIPPMSMIWWVDNTWTVFPVDVSVPSRMTTTSSSRSCQGNEESKA